MTETTIPEALLDAGVKAAKAAFNVLNNAEVELVGFGFDWTATVSFTDTATNTRLAVDDEGDYTLFGSGGNILDTNIGDEPVEEDGVADAADDGVDEDSAETFDPDDSSGYVLADSVRMAGQRAAQAAADALVEAGIAFDDLQVSFDSEGDDDDGDSMLTLSVAADGSYMVFDVVGEVLDSDGLPEDAAEVNDDQETADA